jgi:hypothetical protein
VLPPGSAPHMPYLSSRDRSDSSISAYHRLLHHSLHMSIDIAHIDPPSHFHCPHSMDAVFRQLTQHNSGATRRRHPAKSALLEMPPGCGGGLA